MYVYYIYTHIGLNSRLYVDLYIPFFSFPFASVLKRASQAQGCFGKLLSVRAVVNIRGLNNYLYYYLGAPSNIVYWAPKPYSNY